MADLMNMQPDEYKLLGMNFASGRPWGIACVVWHHMAGDLDADACNRVWRGAGTSAHYSVDKSGYIVQHVRDMDRAYACGDGIGRGSLGNDRGVSIEFANDMSSKWRVHEASLEAGAHLTAALCRFYDLGRPEWMVNVFPHSHFAATACPGELAGSQNAHAMERAQHWYDVMTGSKPEEKPQPAPKPSGIDVDGFWGSGTTRRAQEVAGLVADGEVWGQNPDHRGAMPACTSGWCFDTCEGSPLIRFLQGRWGVEQDGVMGPDTINAMISYYMERGSGAYILDGRLDAESLTVKAFQRELNAGRI